MSSRPLNNLPEKPAGAIRITTTEYDTVLWPSSRNSYRNFLTPKGEIVIEKGLIDVVAERCVAGARLGEQAAKDMIAVRIGADIRMAVSGASSISGSGYRHGQRLN